MTWTCEQTELRLSDYLDRSLTPAEMEAFNAHVPTCQRCAPLLASVSSLVTGLQSVEQVTEPPRLVYSILDRTLGPRESQTGWRGMLGWVGGVASLRFAYGALSVAATLLILVTASGFNWHHPKLADLRPASVYREADRKAHRVYASTTKFVNDLRVVNEIQSRLRQDNELPTLEENTAPRSNAPKDPGHSDGSKPAAPRQQNRANDLARHLGVLAEDVPACRWNLSALWIARRVL
jgi:anti-sigma factor RsiW